MAQLTFYGGAGSVTGSKHLIEVNGSRILLDCGTFQGLPDIRERNRAMPFPPESVTAVVLSHAHIDHCGMLPLLVRRGFKGQIFSTPATRDVTARMLADAAAIEVQDAEYRLQHHYGAPDEREPLFTPEDIAPTMEQFTSVPYARAHNVWHPITDSVRLKFYDAGHILGSAITVLEITEKGQKKHLLYTGDLGPPGLPLLYDPELPPESVAVVLAESTYGGRHHAPLQEAVDRLAAVVNEVEARGGKMIVPSFSLGRTQLLVYLLHKLTDEGKIPRLPIYVDSPLSVDITEVFEKHSENYDSETWQDFKGADHGPLLFRNLTYIRSSADSKRLNTKPGPFVVIASSGMMTAGRVVHHVRQTLDDDRNAILIAGYQAQGTLGRQLVDGVTTVTIFGAAVPVRAQIHLFNEFSAHADQVQLASFLGQLQGVQQVFLVHGEPEQADAFKHYLQTQQPSWQVNRPQEGQSVEF